MARVNLDALAAPRAGVAPAPVAAIADGHSFTNNGRRQVYVENSTAGALTVEVPLGNTVDGLTVPPKVITVPAAVAGNPGKQITGFFGPEYTRADGTVWINYPVSAGLSVRVIEPSLAD